MYYMGCFGQYQSYTIIREGTSGTFCSEGRTWRTISGGRGMSGGWVNSGGSVVSGGRGISGH